MKFSTIHYKLEEKSKNIVEVGSAETINDKIEDNLSEID